MPGALVFGSPLWLVAGALATLAPLLLHLIAPRPPARAPLPTARFLEAQSRARRTLARRPHDVPLLLLRCAFLLLLGGALASPRLVPARSGIAHLLLVDSVASGDAAALAELRARAGPDAIEVTLADSGFAAALRALPRLALERTRADSVRAWWLADMRWRSWTPGTSTLRAEAWTAAIGVVPGGVPGSPMPALDQTGRVLVLGTDSAVDDVHAALAALGHDVVAAESPAETGPARAVVVLDAARGDTARAAAWARSGATVIVVTIAGAPSTRTLSAADAMLPDAVGTSVETGSGGRIVAAWSDGRPAAVADAVGSGCIVRTGIDLAVTPSPALPDLLEELLGACAPPADPAAALPLDAGARGALAGGGAQAAPVAMLPGADAAGEPLARWLLLAALVSALLETALAARHDRGTTRAAAGTSSP